MKDGKPFVIIAPDSFKGTASAQEVASSIADGILKAYPKASVILIPVADGGEGTVSALCGENIKKLTVSGPFGNKTESFYGFIDEKTAVIEMAAAAGLPLAMPNLNPKTATTYGVGELILDALKSGAKRIYLGLGGSATTDGGCGMASALDVVFSDKDGKKFVPAGGTLADIAHIDTSNISPLLNGTEIICMCDIDNPLYGQNGAAYVFAPQKGADEVTVKELDFGLRNLANVINNDLKIDVSAISGGGAAGGCGAGCVAFLGAKLKSGIESVLQAKDFMNYLPKADLVITGEGRFDSQSISGKVVDGIAVKTKNSGVPLVVLCGGDIETPEAYEKGVTAVFSIGHGVVSRKEAYASTKEYLRRTAENAARLFFK